MSKVSKVRVFIDPVFAKTSPKRSLLLIENERFGLVFAKTGTINLSTVWTLGSHDFLYVLSLPATASRATNDYITVLERIGQCTDSPEQRVHRVAMATFWRTLHHDGKISPAWFGRGCTPPPHHLSLYLSKVVVDAPAERVNTLTPISTLSLYGLCGPEAA